MRINKSINKICALFFCLIVAYIFITNFSYITEILFPKFEKTDISGMKDLTKQLELDYHNSFHERNELIDIYGITQSVLQKKVIGNFDFYKDDAGLMHQFSNYLDVQDSANKIVLLSQRVKEKGIPFLYVQIPARESKNITSYPATIFNQNSKMIDKAISILKEKKVDCLNIEDELADSHFSYEKLFLHSDLHLQTNAEIWILIKIIDYLENKYNIIFENKNDILNMDNYNKKTYEFIGNLARSSGKYFAGSDWFDEYIPKFETSMIMDNSIQGEYREGAFESTVMNQYETKLYPLNKEYTYWVTDYMQFTSPYYNIKNKNIHKNNILVIMDSLAYRTFSYMSLASANITILDTRCYNGIDYTSMILNNNNFDAVIYCHSTSLFGYPIFPHHEEIDLPVKKSKENNTNMWIDICNGNILDNQSDITVNRKMNTITLSGWAADLDVLLPASKVYINVDEYTIDCNYGITRQDLAKHFNNESMSNCGFKVSIPTSVIENSKTGMINFHIVSADGKSQLKVSVHVKVEGKT